MLETVLSYSIPIIVPAIAGLFSYLVALLIALIKTKINKVKNDELREALNHATNELSNTVDSVVKEISVNLVEDMKKNGSFTRENATKTKNLAAEKVKSLLKSETKEILVKNLPNFEEMIATRIEKSVFDIKNKK